MTVIPNPRPIAERVVDDRLADLFASVEFDPNLIGAVRQVATVDALGLDDVSIGDEVFVRDRGCNFRLLRTTVGKYLSVTGNSGASYDGNRLEMTGANLGGIIDFPIGATIQVRCRIASGSTLPNAAYDIALYDQRFGFKTSGFEVGTAKLEVVSIEKETGEFIDPTTVEKGIWYLAIVRVITAFTVSTTQKIVVGTYYSPTTIHFRDIRILGASVQGVGPLTFYKNFESGTSDGMTLPSGKTVTYPDNEDTSNLKDIIKLENDTTYKLWKVSPQGGYITPQNIGAKRQLSTYNYSPEIDATEHIQHLADNRYKILIDGCYCVLGTVNLKYPTDILLRGEGSVDKRITNGDTGCCYSGATPVDMFRIFSSGVSIRGGQLEVRNAVYSGTTSEYYKPPSVIKHCYFYNVIQSGCISTKIVGEVSQTKQFGRGHIGCSVDCSNDYAGDPKSKPAGFGEMHYVNYKGLAGTGLRALVHTSLEEPYQDYPVAAYSHGDSGGFLVTGATLDTATDPDTYTIVTPSSSYSVENGLRRFFTIKWVESGTPKILSFRCKFEGTIASQINRAITEKGYSLDVLQGVVPAFKAEAYGTNQAFRIRSNRNMTSLKVFRPPLATLHNMAIESVGCKQAFVLDTMDSTTLTGSLQTGTVLDVGEYDLPLGELVGDNIRYDLQTIDLNKANSGQYRTNKYAWENRGALNEPFGNSLESINNYDHVKHLGTPNAAGIFLRNPKRLHYSGAGTNQSGFIGPVENALYNAHLRFPTLSAVHSDGSFGTLGNLFTNNSSGYVITYNSGFDEGSGTVVITIPLGSVLELLSVYLQLGSNNTPKSASVKLTGSGGATTITVDLSGPYQEWLMFEGFNVNNNTELELTLTGVKDKSQTVTLMQLMGKNKTSAPASLPILTTAGGVRIYGATEFETLKAKSADSAYRSIMPQAEGTNTTVADLVTKLKAAGVLY